MGDGQAVAVFYQSSARFPPVDARLEVPPGSGPGHQQGGRLCACSISMFFAHDELSFAHDELKVLPGRTAAAPAGAALSSAQRP